MTAPTDLNTTACYTIKNVVNILPDDLNTIIVLCILVLGFFGLGLWFRRKAIYSPMQVRLRAEADALKKEAEVDILKNEADAIAKKKAQGQLETANKIITMSKSCCIINSGRLMAGWRMFHNAKLEKVEQYQTDRLRAKLKIVRARLSEIDNLDAKDTVREINTIIKQFESTEIDAKIKQIIETLKNNENADIKTKVAKIEELLSEKAQKQPSDITLKTLLEEGMRVYYEHQDNYYEMLADWQNKSTWLMFIALLFITTLVVLEENTILLVAGGIGGLLSKLRSVIQKPDTPSDYGFSWSTLFLTPLIGMLTGWAGVYIVLVLIKIKVFGQVLVDALMDGNTCSQLALMVIALVFGYAAGLFEKMISRIEDYATKEKKKIEKSSEKADEDADQ